MAELIVYHKNQKLFCVPLDANQFTIGRSSKNDLILTGDQVSRQHAIIVKRDELFHITDLSQAGTFIDGNKTEGSCALITECKINIADWIITFKPSSLIQQEEEQRRQTQITKLTTHLQREATKILKFSNSQTYKRLKPMLIINDACVGNRAHHIKKNRTVVGSAANCDIILQDEFVSKYHAEFRLSDQGFHVIDLDSTNGTFVDLSKIKECYLKGNEKIKLGNSDILVTFEECPPTPITPYNENNFCGIYGQSHVMRLLFSKIQKVAETDMTLMVQGETGTGKELIARALHDLSLRSKHPYVVINCAAISQNLIESELFGHEKGAFTGADEKHLGAFEQANFGTIFLDEIGELSLDLQAKLLRVLEYQTFRRIGGNQDIKVNVRIIAATHRDLNNMVSNNLFREDLFYRLFVLCLHVPSLRQRKEDIELLAKTFIDKCSSEHSLYLDQHAVEKLKKHTWPGNIRELKNTILRAIAFCQHNHITDDDIEFIHTKKEPLKEPEDSQDPDQLLKEKETVEQFISDTKKNIEREQIITALNKTKGDKDLAAKLMGIGRSTLFRKLKDLDIDVKNFEAPYKKGQK